MKNITTELIWTKYIGTNNTLPKDKCKCLVVRYDWNPKQLVQVVIYDDGWWCDENGDSGKIQIGDLWSLYPIAPSFNAPVS